MREAVAALDGVEKRISREFEHKRILNHELARLVAYAQHAPNKMPKYKPPQTNEEAADEIAQAKVRGFFMARAQGIA